MPTAEEIAKQWAYPDRKFRFTHEGGGPLSLSTMSVKVLGSYDETIAKIDRFYSEKCGSSVNHAEPEKIMFYDKAETKEGGKSLIHTLHIHQKDIVYLHSTTDYTITVLVRPERNGDRIEILLSIAVR